MITGNFETHARCKCHRCQPIPPYDICYCHAILSCNRHEGLSILYNMYCITQLSIIGRGRRAVDQRSGLVFAWMLDDDRRIGLLRVISYLFGCATSAEAQCSDSSSKRGIDDVLEVLHSLSFILICSSEHQFVSFVKFVVSEDQLVSSVVVNKLRSLYSFHVAE